MSKSPTTTKSIERPSKGWSLRRVATHPGEVLREDFLVPYGLSQHALAMRIHVPATRIGDIVHGRRAITPDTALRLARFFGTSPQLWMNLQQAHDLSKVSIDSAAAIEREVEVLA